MLESTGKLLKGCPGTAAEKARWNSGDQQSAYIHIAAFASSHVAASASFSCALNPGTVWQPRTVRHAEIRGRQSARIPGGLLTGARESQLLFGPCLSAWQQALPSARAVGAPGASMCLALWRCLCRGSHLFVLGCWRCTLAVSRSDKACV